MTSLKTHRRIELVEESRRMLDRVVKALLERYRADPGVDKKLLSDIRTIFVEDLKDEACIALWITVNSTQSNCPNLLISAVIDAGVYLATNS